MVIISTSVWLPCLNSFIHSLIRRLKEYYRRQKEYYFIYKHRLLFAVVLAFSRALTNYAIINVLAWYFTDHGEDLVVSSIMSNIHGSLSSVLVVLMANAADSYVGRFYTILFSNTAYIGGLMLLLMFNPYDVKWLVVILLVLLALGTSGDKLLQEVLTDLVNDLDKSEAQTKERSIARAEIWPRIAKVVAAICAMLFVSQIGWGIQILICIVFMTICLIIFCTGHNSYHQGQLTERPVGVFFRVLHMGIKELLIKRKSWDYAGKITTIQWVMSLLRMFPMWEVFLVVYLISATGSTFFFEQYNNLNTNNQIAVQIYGLIKDVSSFAIPFLYPWICGLRKNNEKVKVGVGMLCGIVSCVFAWQLEVQRLKRVNNLDDKNANTSLSFLWLVPQFCVIGGMEGLTGEGLLNFYKSQMKEETLHSYGEEYIEFVTGFGTFLNIILILIFKSRLGWFGNTVNESRLDKYYLHLVFVGLVNFIIYCLFARFYYKDADRHQDLMNDDLINQRLDELLPCDNREQDNQPLANDEQVQENQL
uniref:protein NRT1/ PTR FAMILY 5.6-like n=1 Tax=Erigeron canadensis TaxID=72917 RepID=UPI001CB90504|nr:protein NRT1/ PTR FAMILY 5.6-like [Erigeron canadensis]